MKQQEDLIGLSRSPVVNQLHSIRESITKKPPRYNMHGLVHQNVFQWLWKNLLHLGNTRYTYQTYQDLKRNNGIFKMDDTQGTEVSVALLGDWASDTPESHKVAALCGERDYSIHLGDAYYVGNEKEIACNFNSSFGAPWPYGKRGSFALLGNHEMYSSGKAYFTQLLPYMTVSEAGEVKGQEASFFCLENKYWRVIGIDTGYTSVKGFLGVGSNKKLKLHDKQIEWIKDVVQPEKDNRGLIFLSHHQPLSAFEDEYVNPAGQLAELVGANRNVLWFWGHEHRMALYGENVLDNGLKIFGRCMGNSGMPVEVDKAPKKGATRNLVVYDARERKKISGKYPVGYNGYAIMKFNGPTLVVEYYDDDDNKEVRQERKVLEERWTVADGKLTGSDITDFTAGWPKKLTNMQVGVEKAIKVEAEVKPLIG
ncbi:MAG TPA: metallophosphoesterase [Flavisolibacter sp.]|jgi:hypothetical protein|nr:metallophosphoesterase [Flavisolibacter sp.]